METNDPEIQSSAQAVINQIESLHLAIAKSENPLPLLKSLAQIYIRQSQYTEAINVYIEILNINPHCEEIQGLYEFANIIVKQSQLDIYASPNTNNDPWF
jgi:tetratricopeptide (TPR) repeat protein